jgi:hypothetical protein
MESKDSGGRDQAQFLTTETWRPGCNKIVVFILFWDIDLIKHSECLTIVTKADHVFSDFDVAMTAEPVFKVRCRL